MVQLLGLENSRRSGTKPNFEQNRKNPRMTVPISHELGELTMKKLYFTLPFICLWICIVTACPITPPPNPDVDSRIATLVEGTHYRGDNPLLGFHVSWKGTASANGVYGQMSYSEGTFGEAVNLNVSLWRDGQWSMGEPALLRNDLIGYGQSSHDYKVLGISEKDGLWSAALLRYGTPLVYTWQQYEGTDWQKYSLKNWTIIDSVRTDDGRVYALAKQQISTDPYSILWLNPDSNPVFADMQWDLICELPFSYSMITPQICTDGMSWYVLAVEQYRINVYRYNLSTGGASLLYNGDVAGSKLFQTIAIGAPVVAVRTNDSSSSPQTNVYAQGYNDPWESLSPLPIAPNRGKLVALERDAEYNQPLLFLQAESAFAYSESVEPVEVWTIASSNPVMQPLPTWVRQADLPAASVYDDFETVVGKDGTVWLVYKHQLDDQYHLHSSSNNGGSWTDHGALPASGHPNLVSPTIPEPSQLAGNYVWIRLGLSADGLLPLITAQYGSLEDERKFALQFMQWNGSAWTHLDYGWSIAYRPTRDYNLFASGRLYFDHADQPLFVQANSEKWYWDGLDNWDEMSFFYRRRNGTHQRWRDSRIQFTDGNSSGSGDICWTDKGLFCAFSDSIGKKMHIWFAVDGEQFRFIDSIDLTANRGIENTQLFDCGDGDPYLAWDERDADNHHWLNLVKLSTTSSTVVSSNYDAGLLNKLVDLAADVQDDPLVLLQADPTASPAFLVWQNNSWQALTSMENATNTPENLVQQLLRTNQKQPVLLRGYEYFNPDTGWENYRFEAFSFGEKWSQLFSQQVDHTFHLTNTFVDSKEYPYAFFSPEGKIRVAVVKRPSDQGTNEHFMYTEN